MGEPRTIRTRLREWWRVHHQDRGTVGSADRRYLRQYEEDRDSELGFRVRLALAYPDSIERGWNWYVVYRGIPYLAPTFEAGKALVYQLMEADGVPRCFAPSPRIIHANFRHPRRPSCQPQTPTREV
jgi:hypothetical protein